MPRYTDDELLQLLKLTKCGNKAAQEIFYKLSFRFAWKTMTNLYPDIKNTPDIMEDMLQEAVLCFDRTIAKYNPDKGISLIPYLSVSMRGTIKHVMSKAKLHNERFILLDSVEGMAGANILQDSHPDFDPETYVRMGDYYRKVDHYMQTLGPDLYLIFTLSMYQLSALEIAEMIGESVDYVYRKKRLYRRKLRQAGLHEIN